MAGEFGIDTSGKVVLSGNRQTAESTGLTLGGGGVNTNPYQGQARQIGGENMAGIAAAVQARRQHDTGMATMDALNKLSGNMLDPYVQAMQNKAYFEGAAKVVQGRTLMEVKEEQPWYTKIFGPSASVRGAQAMTVMKTVADAQTQFVKDMPTLRTQSPDEVREYLVRQATRVNVGDAGMDNLIKTKMMEGWGPMLEMHTKQNYAYVQEQNVNAYNQWHGAEGDNLQALMGQGARGLSEETTQAIRQRVLQGLARPEGMDAASHKKALQNVAQGNLARGNFAWFRIFKQSAEFNAMDLDDQAKILNLQTRYEGQYKNKASANEDIGIRSATFLAKANAGLLSPNEVIAQARLFNEEYATLTASETPYFTAEDLGNLVKGNVGAILRAEERRDAKLEKVQEKKDEEFLQNQMQAHYYRAARAGQGSMMWTIPKGDKSLAEASFAQMYQSDAAKDPRMANKLLLDNYLNAEYVNPIVANSMLAGVRATVGQGYTDAFQSSYAQYKNLRDMPGGDSVAAAYFGDYAKQMERYHTQVTGGVDPATAWNFAFKAEPDLRAGINRAGGKKAFDDQVYKAIDDEYGGVFAARPSLQGYARTILYDAVAQDTSDRTLGSGWDIGKAAQVSIKTSRFDQLGNDGYVRREGQLPVDQALRLPKEGLHQAWTALRDRKFKAIGADPASIQNMIRLPGDEVSLQAVFLDKNGNWATMTFAGPEIEAQYNADFKFRDNSKQPAGKANSLSARAGTQSRAATAEAGAARLFDKE